MLFPANKSFGGIGLPYRLAKAALVAAAFSVASITAAQAAEPDTFGENTQQVTLQVTVDRAKVVRIAKPAETIIIGNPAIVDAAVQDSRTLVLTGRSFGVTNIIILDVDGNPIIDETVVVKGHETNTVRVYRRSIRETLACSPVCEPTLTIGDDAAAFKHAESQIRSRNKMAEGSGR